MLVRFSKIVRFATVVNSGLALLLLKSMGISILLSEEEQNQCVGLIIIPVQTYTLLNGMDVKTKWS